MAKSVELKMGQESEVPGQQNTSVDVDLAERLSAKEDELLYVQEELEAWR